MINHNLLLYGVLDRTMNVDFNGKNYTINYTEGDLFEIAAKLKDSSTKYPIIWLQTGYKVQRDKQRRETSLVGCRFFFITLGSKTDRYKQRFESTYNNMLYQCLVKFDKIIRTKKGITASNIDDFVVFPFNDVDELSRREANNGSRSAEQSTTITDIWDALLLETDLVISDGCFPQLIIK